MIENNVSLENIADIIKTKNNILIISHVRPDGDTLACAFALKSVLTELGKNVICVSSDRASDRLSFLCKSGLLLPSEVPSEFLPELVIAVDVASTSMLGDCLPFIGRAASIKIDHHAPEDVFGCDNYYTDNNAAACSEIIFDLINMLTETMSDEVCSLLYAGICYDTGCFMHSNVTEKTLLKSAYLVSRGVNTSDINHKLFGNKTKKEIEALKMAYNSLEYFADGKIAVICITNEMRKEKALSEDDVSELAQIPIDIDGISIGITLKEKENAPNNFKVSMRSRPGVNAGNACKRLGGGGHFCAAGGLIVAKDKYDAIKQAVNAAIPEINI